jgi:hypothetical protein
VTRPSSSVRRTSCSMSGGTIHSSQRLRCPSASRP